MSFYMFFDDLIKNPQYCHISSDAKILYTLMCNRASLSEKNGDVWRQKDGTIFIYFSQTEVMELLRCGHDKASKVYRELEQVKLIRRIPQGLGKAHKVIVNCAFQTSETKHSAKRNPSNPDSDKSAPNYINKKNLESSYLESTLPPDRRMVEEKIKDNIAYEILANELDNDVLNGIVEIIVETLCMQTDTISIAGQRRRFCDVSARLLSLNDLHIRHVYKTIRDNPNPVRHPRAYLLKLLYEANWSMVI